MHTSYWKLGFKKILQPCLSAIDLGGSVDLISSIISLSKCEGQRSNPKSVCLKILHHKWKDPWSLRLRESTYPGKCRSKGILILKRLFDSLKWKGEGILYVLYIKHDIYMLYFRSYIASRSCFNILSPLGISLSFLFI